MIIDKVFSERLKMIRKARGMDQVELSKLSGIAYSTISYYESGTTSPKTERLKAICLALNVRSDCLLGLSDPEESEVQCFPKVKNKKVFSERLKHLREDKGMSKKTLAELIGMSSVSIINYETGKSYPKKDKLINFSSIFEVSMDYLTGLSE